MKLKELEEKTKHAQENMKRMAETTPASSTSLLLPMFEISLGQSIPAYLAKKPSNTSSAIFQPPKTV